MRLRPRSRPRAYDRALETTQSSARPNGTAYPSGWYVARFSRHLKRGQVVPVTFMSRHYALFRTRSGRVGMVESQCCHLGADLSRCGRVAGEHLLCGFHAWAFDSSGRCTDIPGQDRIPARAGQRSLPVTEQAGNIWFWHGDGPPHPLDTAAFADDRRRYVTLPGQVSVFHVNLLSVAEHVADLAHWPYSHQAHEPMEYVPVRDEGPHFEFRIQPAAARTSRRMQRFFRPYALVTMAGPTATVFRAQTGPHIDRDHPAFAAILGASPVRDGVTFSTWRVAVRKLGPDLPLWPLNRLLAVLVWLVVRRNARADQEILRWMQPLEKPLWVKSDGPSVREFQRFYHRQTANPHPPGDS
ncbi:Rieske 2Fe-2S domain-containing protein [Streptomyces sp. XH2]|uniref:Rieske 2Fe-2S domain-containing protein n=1 Tax=Streptomyces sp. XH2 TaxID=3412483 RepID=UPI003C7E38BB